MYAIRSYYDQCGMLWGAALAAGAQSYRQYGPGPQAEAEAILATQKLMGAFRTHTKNEINCLEISHLNLQGNAVITSYSIHYTKLYDQCCAPKHAALVTHIRYSPRQGHGSFLFGFHRMIKRGINDAHNRF